MMIRHYKTEDCPILAQLFYDTVHSVNAKDYAQAQLDVWATGQVDISAWNESFLSHVTAVVTCDTQIIGFGDMDHNGYLDRLYVHQDFQRQGVGTEICDWLESSVVSDTYITHASITAKPFFENRGYRIVKEQQVDRKGILLTNYVMEKKR